MISFSTAKKNLRSVCLRSGSPACLREPGWEKPRDLLCPGDTEGLQPWGNAKKTLGIHAYPLYSLKLEDVKIPADNQLNGPDGHPLEGILASWHIALAAMAVGVAQAAYEYAIDYAKDREVFGVKVAQKQAIAFMLAEMGTDIEATRLMTWEAAWMIDEGKEEAYKHAFLAYSGAVDMVMMVTDRAVQILGGHGYIRGAPRGTVDEKRPGLCSFYRLGHGIDIFGSDKPRTGSSSRQRKEKDHD